MPRPYEQITLTQVATFPRPGMVVPGAVRFTPDSSAITYLFSAEGSLVRSLWRYDIETGERTVVAGPPPASTSEANLSREEELRRERARLRELGVTSYEFAASAETPVLLVPGGGRLWTSAGGSELKELPGSEGAIDPHLSPDGGMVAFVRGNELFVLATEGGEPRQLTSGSEPGLTNGLAEFIAQEELDRDRGFWWSPDGARIAFARADSRHIPDYAIVHQGKAAVETEPHRYPFAGAPNAYIDLAVVDIATGDTVWMDLGQERDIYLARVGWRPDGVLTAQLLSRDQRTLRLVAFEETGRSTTLIEEHREPWLNLFGDTRFLKDGSILWQSEESGFAHLYVHSPEGRRLRQLTTGDWVVTSIVAVDEERGQVYFSGTKDSVLERHLYAVPLDGGEIRRLTSEPGWHGAVVAPDGSMFVDTWSSLQHGPRSLLRTIDGSGVGELFGNEGATAAELGLEPPEFTSFSVDGGIELHGMIYTPPATDALRRHPLVVSVYGGPHVQRVANEWSATVDLRAQYLAQQGFVVFKLDNRGSFNRGLAFEGALADRMGTVEVDDQMAGVRHLAKLPYVDASRVGIYGWSYGGYMTLMGMLRQPDVFKVGVAGAPVADWDGYDTGYTERYMGTPQSNPEGYHDSSALTHAHKLEGKLLLVHGMTDENVHFRHTARFIVALTEANKDYDLLIFPEERHMPRDAKGMEYQERRVMEYFERNL